MNACTIALSNGLVFTRAFIRDPYRRNLINAVSNCFDGVFVHSTAYSHDLLSRRTNSIYTAQTGTNMLSCSCNARSEVTGVTIDTNDYAYIYDNIGNNLHTSLNTVTNAYTVNNLNQYKAVTNLLDLSGIELAHDEDGNTTLLGEHELAFDDENRLSLYLFGWEPGATGTIQNAYIHDHLGRRVKKMVQDLRVDDPGGMLPPTYWWHTNEVTTFVYDGWNLIHERVAHTNGTVDEIEYVWGLDLSGTLQGSGGVGGLLYEKRNGVIYIPCYDANGNITAYIDTNGTVRASYIYDAFGKTISQSGDMANFFHFRFSTKYFDDDTGLYYYGYRYYSPMLQRWINRDPIEETDAANLYLFVNNSPTASIDFLRLFGYTIDKECACHIEELIKKQKGDTDKLADMYQTWKIGENFSTYGFGVVANAAGYRSSELLKKPKCYQEVIEKIEKNWQVNSMQAAQLAIIGAHGYWNPVMWLFSESGYAKTQWWLTRITIEQFRVNWVLSELNKVKIEVDSKFGKDYSERCCENETKQ